MPSLSKLSIFASAHDGKGRLQQVPLSSLRHLGYPVQSSPAGPPWYHNLMRPHQLRAGGRDAPSEATPPHACRPTPPSPLPRVYSPDEQGTTWPPLRGAPPLPAAAAYHPGPTAAAARAQARVSRPSAPPPGRHACHSSKGRHENRVRGPNSKLTYGRTQRQRYHRSSERAIRTGQRIGCLDVEATRTTQHRLRGRPQGRRLHWDKTAGRDNPTLW